MRLTLELGPHRLTLDLSHCLASDDEQVEQRDSALDAYVDFGPQQDLTQHPTIGFGGSHD